MNGANAVRLARRPEDLFGELDGDSTEQLRQARGTFRKLAREVHPDCGGDGQDFARLEALWRTARVSIDAGTYGTALGALVDPVLIRTKRNAYTVERVAARGDVANVYDARYEHGHALLKIARRQADNDLLVNEAKVLKHLLSQKEVFDDVSPYLPLYIESFGYRTKADRKPRQVNAFVAPEQDFYTLAQVREAYPDGVHPKDMAWMLRRLLMALGWAHKFGRIHGAILPEHVLIQPEQHGLYLVDWTASVEYGERIKVISAPWRTWYPQEVNSKSPAIPGTDIYMAVNCMHFLLGMDPGRGRMRALLEAPPTVPPALTRFFAGCQQAAARRRPQDAWALLDEFNELLERMWGPRRFRPFYMTPNGKEVT